MKKIIVKYQPFDFNQQILVMSDGKVENVFSTSLNGVTDMVTAIAKEKDISKVELIGNHNYLSKFVAEFNTKFSDSNLDVSIVEI